MQVYVQVVHSYPLLITVPRSLLQENVLVSRVIVKGSVKFFMLVLNDQGQFAKHNGGNIFSI